MVRFGSNRLFEGLEELGSGTLASAVGKVEDCKNPACQYPYPKVFNDHGNGNSTYTPQRSPRWGPCCPRPPAAGSHARRTRHSGACKGHSGKNWRTLFRHLQLAIIQFANTAEQSEE